MKTPPLLCLLLALGLAIPTARAQFPNFPAADRVLGATDFTSVGTGALTPSGTPSVLGVAIHPLTGKLFVGSYTMNRVLRFADSSTLSNGANAEAVFGQPNFSGFSTGTTATSCNGPFGTHVDRQGRLWVADLFNNRVLMFHGASTFVGPADRVFGQPDFTTASFATSATKMHFPTMVFVDAADNLWVADSGNQRVLKFANVSSLLSGASATTVLGQPDFTTSTSGTNSAKMKTPASVFVDESGRLWVTDQGNHRVLRFDNAATLGNGASAVAVLGQPDFGTAVAQTDASSLSTPTDLLVDPSGTLYVSEQTNHRVLLFKNAATKANGSAADGVIGQSDFTANTAGTTDRKMNTPGMMARDLAGNLWVADLGNNRVLRFSPDRTATPPKLTGKAPKTTTAATLALRGTASDTSGVARVKYRVGKGPIKNAAGTTALRLTATLKPGKNTIEIVTVDTLGSTSAPKRVIVKRL